jgi:hypothetical protein
MLLGISALAAVFALRFVSRRRLPVERRLADFGFEPCEADAPALERAWRAITACSPSRELQVVDCRSRTAGLGMMHHFTVLEQTRARAPSGEGSKPRASYPAYLLDLRNAGSVCRGAVTLYVAPPIEHVNGRSPVDTNGFSDSRPILDVGTHSWSASIVAAHSERGGKLDDLVPAEVQAKLVRAAAHGFSSIHLSNGKAAFATRSNHDDVEDQIAYLAEWL